MRVFQGTGSRVKMAKSGEGDSAAAATEKTTKKMKLLDEEIRKSLLIKSIGQGKLTRSQDRDFKLD